MGWASDRSPNMLRIQLDTKLTKRCSPEVTPDVAAVKRIFTCRAQLSDDRRELRNKLSSTCPCSDRCSGRDSARDEVRPAVTASRAVLREGLCLLAPYFLTGGVATARSIPSYRPIGLLLTQ